MSRCWKEHSPVVCSQGVNAYARLNLSWSLMYKVLKWHMLTHLGLVARKPVFGVSDKASFKQVSSATETSWIIEISTAASLHMILSKMRITKALIRLR